jgi:hypothetical protein
MKIIIDRSNEERQQPIVTIDTNNCHYPYAVRKAIELALELDGYTQSTIKEVFHQIPDIKCKPSPDLEREG